VSETILIADDSLLVREAVQTALRDRGARVVLASDGEEARARLREAAPDLVLADVHMPGLDGYALCREAKTERAATRVVLLVGTFEPFDSSAASFARADGVLRKPFVVDELMRKVVEMLGPARVAAPEPVRAAIADAHPAAGPVEPSAAPASEPAASEEIGSGQPELSDADVDRIARRVLELGGGAVLERVARELLSAQARRGDPERE
jgi:CheY-like chemotaxis protein